MDTKISILFYARKACITTDHLMPIYLRVTINGQRFEISAKRYLESHKWSIPAGKAKGNTEEARNINNYLDMLKQKVYILQKELIQEGRPVNLENFKYKWLGKCERPHMLLEIFQDHNNQVKLLVGKDFAPGTLERYKTSLKHTRSFIQ